MFLTLLEKRRKLYEQGFDYWRRLKWEYKVSENSYGIYENVKIKTLPDGTEVAMHDYEYWIGGQKFNYQTHEYYHDIEIFRMVSQQPMS